METQKRRRGDRRDGRLLRELDSLHFITGIIYPNRCDNEAYISERIDLTPVKAYMARRNETETDFPYTYFHLVLTALVKTITLRPKMNRFIVNGNFFQRNEVTASFVVKKQFSDKGAEALAMLHTTGDDTIDTRLKMFTHQRDVLLAQMEEMRHTLETVEYKCWYYETAKAAGTIDVPRDMADEDVPKRFRAIRRELKTIPQE